MYDNNEDLIGSDRVEIAFVKPIEESVNFSPTIVAGGVILLLLVAISIIFLVIRNRNNINGQEGEDNGEQIIRGPPISGPPISHVAQEKSLHVMGNQTEPSDVEQTSSAYPPVPQEGLPQGWTLEQWQYYGQQYLDMNRRQ